LCCPARPGRRARSCRRARPGRRARPSLNDTSFKKFNLNFFYKKWILNFEFDPNIWIGFKSGSKYLDLDLKKIQTTFAKKVDLGQKSNPIIWI